MESCDVQCLVCMCVWNRVTLFYSLDLMFPKSFSVWCVICDLEYILRVVRWVMEYDWMVVCECVFLWLGSECKGADVNSSNQNKFKFLLRTIF